MNLLDRANLLARAESDPKAQQAHLTICKSDPVYWFNTFCWTFDPRLERDNDLPFNLYPFQEWAVVNWLADIEDGHDFLIEKCRDMGITWTLLLLFQYCWLFRPGWNFKVGSKKQDDVDKLGDISTHFPKLRYNLRMLPAWMQPEGFDPRRHHTFMKILNPENGNSIVGESANAEFSRSGRFRAVLFDEFAFWDFDDAAWASASHSTHCRIAISTPHGKNNKFAQLALDENNDRLEPVKSA